MASHELSLDGMALHAYFQPYHLNLASGGRPPHVVPGYDISGEILTRPVGLSSPVEEFFSELTVDQHFAVLSWHLELARDLARYAGALTSINLHNSTVQEQEGRERLMSALRTDTPPLTFEFTETYPMPPQDIANKLLREIRRLGHTTALDDFGTGLNGISLLTDFDFDIIKIDRSLTFDLAERLEKQRMLALILKMLDVLGRDHVVEGIEDVEVYGLLLDIGYSQFQGFLFDAPILIEDFIARTQRTHSDGE